ncbi:hypothetical protein HZU77_001405 [Neisseriaceae bacterium TC5R-5]|nr:hypothetical protein [Neisseriaceae bacterium TC5R-5]
MTNPILFFDNDQKHIKRLIKHITDHENSVAKLEYDPIKFTYLMQPLLLETVFNPSVFDDLLFFNIFKNMSVEPEKTISTLFRVYIDGMLSPKYESEILYASPLGTESFENYVTRVTAGHKFGIIINGAEQWSDTLARMAKKIFSPVVALQGFNNTTVEVTLFIGNYGYTPFGIHIDDPYTSVVHFHLGPTIKEMTLFEKDQFHRLNGKSKNCFEPEKLIPYGKTYSIKPGDIFLLPPHYYHIGNTNGFSIGIAFALSKYPKKTMTQHILQHAIHSSSFNSSIEELTDELNSTTDISLREWLRQVNNEYEAIAQSRASLRYSYLRQNITEIMPQTLWQRDPDFPLIQRICGNDLLIYIRGNRLRFINNKLTLHLLASIPDVPFSIKDLYSELKGLISLDTINQVVQQLASLGGICLYCDSSTEIQKTSNELITN